MKELAGPYRIRSLLGHGGMGLVYLGVHDHLGREVAIKALAPELTQHPQFRERFFAEARVQAKLQHTNIVTIYDLIEDAGSYFIVMEYVPGPTLEELLKNGSPRGWEIEHTLALFQQVLAGLDYAHSKGVIHRDVKSSNVLVADGDQVKLTDFGIALLIGDKRLTASQSTIGTPTYMSPEQILRPRDVDHRSDVYSAAIVLYEMLAGQPPFDAGTEYELKKLQIEAPVPDVRTVNPRVPGAVAEAITVAMRKDPDERFPSAGAFLRALRTQAGTTPALSATPDREGPGTPISPLTPETTSKPRFSSKLLLPAWQRWALGVALALFVALTFALLLPQEEVALQEPEVEAPPLEPAAAPNEPMAEGPAMPPAELAEAAMPIKETQPPPSPRPPEKAPPDPTPREPTRKEIADEKFKAQLKASQEEIARLRRKNEEEQEKLRQEALETRELISNGYKLREPSASPPRELIEPSQEVPPAPPPAARKLTVTRVKITPQVVAPDGQAVATAHVTVDPPFEQPAQVHVRVRVMRNLEEITDPISQAVTIPARGGTWRFTIPIKIPKQAPVGGCYIDIELWDSTQQVKSSGRIGFTIR